MLKFGEKVFVVIADKVQAATIHGHVSHRGVVTGYEITFMPAERLKFKKADIYLDFEDANKALFLKTLKADKDPRDIPGEDVHGDRHWIQGHKRGMRR